MTYQQAASIMAHPCGMTYAVLSRHGAVANSEHLTAYVVELTCCCWIPFCGLAKFGAGVNVPVGRLTTGTASPLASQIGQPQVLARCLLEPLAFRESFRLAVLAFASRVVPVGPNSPVSSAASRRDPLGGNWSPPLGR
jgi:hypothetical protein